MSVGDADVEEILYLSKAMHAICVIPWYVWSAKCIHHRQPKKTSVQKQLYGMVLKWKYILTNYYYLTLVLVSCRACGVSDRLK